MKVIVDGKEFPAENVSIQFENGDVSGDLEIVASENDVVFKVIDSGAIVASQEVSVPQIIEMTVVDNGFAAVNDNDDSY